MEDLVSKCLLGDGDVVGFGHGGSGKEKGEDETLWWRL